MENLLREQKIKKRIEKIRKLLEIDFVYKIHDHRLIHFLKLLDTKNNNEILEQEEVLNDYYQLQHLINKYHLSGQEMITKNHMMISQFAKQHHMTTKELERQFKDEMNITIEDFINQYLSRPDYDFERWGLTNIPLSEELKTKYHITNRNELRDTYRFKQDGQEFVEIFNPCLISFIDTLENKTVCTHVENDYQTMKKIMKQYEIPFTPQFDYNDFLSHFVGFKNKKELNSYFIAELDMSLEQFMKQIVEKGQFDEVSVWGLIQTKDQGTIETYEFIPTGNQNQIENMKTPLVDYVNEMREQRQHIKPQILTIQDLEITEYPKSIVSHFHNIPTFERNVNELLELQSYGLNLEEIKLFIYQKYLSNHCSLLNADNYLELIKKEIWALIFIHQWQATHHLENKNKEIFENKNEIHKNTNQIEKRKSLYLHN